MKREIQTCSLSWLSWQLELYLATYLCLFTCSLTLYVYFGYLLFIKKPFHISSSPNNSRCENTETNDQPLNSKKSWIVPNEFAYLKKACSLYMMELFDLKGTILLFRFHI